MSPDPPFATSSTQVTLLEPTLMSKLYGPVVAEAGTAMVSVDVGFASPIELGLNVATLPAGWPVTDSAPTKKPLKLGATV